MLGVVFLHVEVDRAVRNVGETFVEDALYESDLFDDVARGVRFDRGCLDVERLHGAVVALGVVVGHLHRFELFEPRFLGDLVFAFVGVVFQMSDVRNVAYVAHLVARSLEVAEKQVESHRRPGVAQVGIAVDRRTADIHARPARDQGLELLLAARKRIVKRQFRFHCIGKFSTKVTIIGDNLNFSSQTWDLGLHAIAFAILR